MGRATAHSLAPSPRALWMGKKVKYHKFHLQSQFERFLYHTLYVFSQIKDMKHTEQDFHLVAWVMPQGKDWVLEGSKV